MADGVCVGGGGQRLVGGRIQETQKEYRVSERCMVHLGAFSLPSVFTRELYTDPLCCPRRIAGHHSGHGYPTCMVPANQGFSSAMRGLASAVSTTRLRFSLLLWPPGSTLLMIYSKLDLVHREFCSSHSLFQGPRLEYGRLQSLCEGCVHQQTNNHILPELILVLSTDPTFPGTLDFSSLHSGPTHLSH